MKNKKDSHVLLPLPSYTAATLGQLSDIKKLTVEDVIVLYAYAEAIVETVREPLVILDGTLRIKTANKSFFDTFHLDKNETYGKRIFDLGNGQWAIPQLKKLLKEILPKNTHFNDFEVEHNFEGIGTRTMILNARRIVLEGHKTELILLAIEAITQKKNAEHKLRETDQHYRWLVEQVKDHIIYTTDTKGIITDWNPTAEDVTGYKREEVIGKFHGLIYTVADTKAGIPKKELSVATKKGRAKNERWHVKKGGILFWGSGSVTPLRDEKGIVHGFSKVMRDVTVQKEQEEKKDEFLSIASHELKTPITTIKAYTQFLIKRLTSSKDTKNTYFLTNIDKQINKLTSLIEDLLNLSKIEAGKLQYSKKQFDINILIQKTVIDFQHITDTHTIHKVGDAKNIVYADPDRIEQVLINLLNNAIKYSPQGSDIIVTMTSSAHEVTVSVQDFGRGIPKSKQSDVFKKYFQVNEKSEVSKRGFGLGLYICSQIIKRHKGKIWVESQKGKGSTFFFTLPLK